MVMYTKTKGKLKFNWKKLTATDTNRIIQEEEIVNQLISPAKTKLSF